MQGREISRRQAPEVLTIVVTARTGGLVVRQHESHPALPRDLRKRQARAVSTERREHHRMPAPDAEHLTRAFLSRARPAPDKGHVTGDLAHGLEPAMKWQPQ